MLAIVIFVTSLLAVAWLSSTARAMQVTEKSIQLSSSSVSASDVTYQIKFRAMTSAGAFVVQFCSNTPLIGQACTQPADFSASSANSTTSGFTDVTGDDNLVVVGGTIAADGEISVDIDGITNPSVAGSIYARIVTYDTKVNAENYTATNLGSGVGDEGSVAIAITPTIGISGTVLETITFCVSASEISANCGSTTTPTIVLGEEGSPGVVALSPGVLSTGAIHTQISTNASTGAVVRLKSSALDCGGLKRSGSPTACDILPALSGGIDPQADEAKFGVKTADATNSQGVSADGAFVPVLGSNYNNSTFALNYTAGNTAGITSTYGDPFLDTAGAPANNKNMKLTFGATIANDTPAGSYYADLSLIASGKF